LRIAWYEADVEVKLASWWERWPGLVSASVHYRNLAPWLFKVIYFVA